MKRKQNKNWQQKKKTCQKWKRGKLLSTEIIKRTKLHVQITTKQKQQTKPSIYLRKPTVHSKISICGLQHECWKMWLSLDSDRQRIGLTARCLGIGQRTELCLDHIDLVLTTIEVIAWAFVGRRSPGAAPIAVPAHWPSDKCFWGAWWVAETVLIPAAARTCE